MSSMLHFNHAGAAETILNYLAGHLTKGALPGAEGALSERVSREFAREVPLGQSAVSLV